MRVRGITYTAIAHNNVVTKVNPPMKADIQKRALRSRKFHCQFDH